MKDIFSSFLKFQKDRIQNPFFLAFTTSWIILNWKMIAFLLFSDKIIEDKFLYIQDNFEIAANMVWWPILSAAAYTFGLQYFNAFVENITRAAVRKQADIKFKKEIQHFEYKRALAIENIRFEEAQTEYREKKSVNTAIEDLQAKYMQAQQDLENEKIDKSKMLFELRSENTKLSELLNSMNTESTNKSLELYKIMEEQTEQLKKMETDNLKLTSIINSRNRINHFSFSNDRQILEIKTKNNSEIQYLDLKQLGMVDEKEFKYLVQKFDHKRTLIFG